jgi:hypothetical protein
LLIFFVKNLVELSYLPERHVALRKNPRYDEVFRNSLEAPSQVAPIWVDLGAMRRRPQA